MNGNENRHIHVMAIYHSNWISESSQCCSKSHPFLEDNACAAQGA